MKNRLLIFFALFTGCIGTDVIMDFVEPQIIIENTVINLQVGDTYSLSAVYLNNTGQPTNEEILWNSSNEQILTVTQDGVLEGISVGVATITAQRNEVQSSVDIMVSQDQTVIMNERMADIMTTSSYPLTGTAILTIDSINHKLAFLEDFSTTSSLPGLYVYLTNNPNTIENALEIGAVKEFDGAQTYTIPDTVQLFTYNYVLFYCKPFIVKVGDGELNP